MRAATLFSGIGAPECARPDWSWLWHAEIEPFPAAVHAQRIPGSVNLGDVLAPDFLERASAQPIDVLVGGPPCQGFSVAGLRGGLSDPRGNLSLRWVQIIHAVRPRYAVTENVPGWLNMPDNSFGCFLGALVGADAALDPPPGAGWPRAGMVAGPLVRAVWRVLDAKHFGLAQRRERVFVVSCSGDGADPAEVLFERKSLRRHPEKGREAGEAVARPIAAGSASSGGYRNDADTADNLIVRALRAEGFDASEDGTGRGTPLVPVAYGGNNTRGPIEVATALNAHGGPNGLLDFDSETFVAQPAMFLHANKGRPDGRKSQHTEMLTVEEEIVPTLATDGHAQSAIAFHARQDPDSGPLTHPLDTDGYSIAVAFQDRFRGDDGRGYGRPPPASCEQIGTLETVKPWHVATSMQVRRLTPRECARLQGFPDDWCDITWRGKPVADGPVYRAYGNSMAVSVLRWLLTRIEAHSSIHLQPRLAQSG